MDSLRIEIGDETWLSTARIEMRRSAGGFIMVAQDHSQIVTIEIPPAKARELREWLNETSDG